MITKANNVRNVNVVLTVLIHEEKFAASPGDPEVSCGAASEKLAGISSFAQGH